MERIAVIGTGPIGTSIGLALKKVGLKNTEVIGQCSDRDVLSIIKKINAFDEKNFVLEPYRIRISLGYE